MADGPVTEQEAPTPYERPSLVVVGNLRDLLAGSGSKGNDDQTCLASNGLDPTC